MNANKAYAKVECNGQTYYLCCPVCQREFERDTARFTRGKNKGTRSHSGG